MVSTYCKEGLLLNSGRRRIISLKDEPLYWLSNIKQPAFKPLTSEKFPFSGQVHKVSVEKLMTLGSPEEVTDGITLSKIIYVYTYINYISKFGGKNLQKHEVLKVELKVCRKNLEMTSFEIGKVKEGVFQKEPSRYSKGSCTVLNRSCEKKVRMGKSLHIEHKRIECGASSLHTGLLILMIILL